MLKFPALPAAEIKIRCMLCKVPTCGRLIQAVRCALVVIVILASVILHFVMSNNHT